MRRHSFLSAIITAATTKRRAEDAPNMAGRQLYSLTADDEGGVRPVAKTTIDAFGAVKDVELASNPGVHYPPEYLVFEGLWIHAKLTPQQLCIRLPVPGRNRTASVHSSGLPQYLDADFRTVAMAVDDLMDELQKDFASRGISLGRGTVVALLSVPSLHLVLHALALWRLDCAVQFFNHDLGRQVMDNLLLNSSSMGTAALLHAGLTREECIGLDIDGLYKRLGVQTVEVPSTHFAAALLSVSRKKDNDPRLPITQQEFAASRRSAVIRIVMHTSGSSGIPKVSRWDLFALGCFMRPPPHIQCDPGNKQFAYLQISRPHWSTSCFLTTFGIASGTAMALCEPRNRIYPSTAEALDLVAHTESKSLLLFPAQALELKMLVQKDPTRYRPILESLASLQFIGASLDSVGAAAVADLALEKKVLVLNLHGLGEIGTTSLTTTSPPFNVLYSTSEAALFEPITEETGGLDGSKGMEDEKLFKLWISMDKHPLLWYQVTQARVPSLKIERFPGAGPMLDRPALDTGDIFEARMMPNGLMAYIHRARDDDLIRLGNLYRPNVVELEAKLVFALTRPAADDERFSLTDVDAVQIMGDGKARLAAVIQLFSHCKYQTEERARIVEAAVHEFDDSLPVDIRLGGLDRVAMCKTDASRESMPEFHGSKLLLKTHKGNLRRTTNTKAWQEWLDGLEDV